jgi:glycosyltransferase involved in cell wall biosynthesis
MKILLVEPAKVGGVYYHRQYVPFKYIEKYRPDIEVTRVPVFHTIHHFIENSPEVFKNLGDYALIYFTREFPTAEPHERIVDFFHGKGVRIVLDIDDFWVLPSWHALYVSYQHTDTVKRVRQGVISADFVTTSTNNLASEIKKVRGDNEVVVIANAIDPEEDQFKTSRERGDDRLRIGWAGGLCHRKDIEEIQDGVKKMFADFEMKGRFQFVLGGFTSSQATQFVENNKIGSNKLHKIQTPLHQQEFFGFEQIMSNNHTGVSDYAKSLLTKEGLFQGENDPMWQHIEAKLSKEPYRRIWGKTPFDYATIYDSFDVAIAPLYEGRFNECKSALKMLEAGFKGLPIVVSDVDPYKEFLAQYPHTAIAVSPSKKHKDWYRAFKNLVNSEAMREDYAKALQEVCVRDFSISIWGETKANVLLLMGS